MFVTADHSQSLFWYNQLIQLTAAQSKETWCLPKPGKHSHGLLYDLGWFTEVLKRAHGPLVDCCSSPSGNGSFLSHQFATSPPVGRSTHLPPLPISRLPTALRTGLVEVGVADVSCLSCLAIQRGWHGLLLFICFSVLISDRLERMSTDSS